jgi:hypothetical protein
MGGRRGAPAAALGAVRMEVALAQVAQEVEEVAAELEGLLRAQWSPCGSWSQSWRSSQGSSS